MFIFLKKNKLQFPFHPRMAIPKPSSGPTTYETADSDSGDGDTVSVHISGADVSVLVGEGGAAGVVEDLDLRIEIPRLGIWTRRR